MVERELDAFYEAVGSTIRRLRAERGMTQAQLGDSVGLARASVANLEAGRQRIQAHTLAMLAVALGVPVADLVPQEDRRLGQLISAVPHDTPDEHRALLERLVANAKGESIRG